jgi:hypothetical protein
MLLVPTTLLRLPVAVSPMRLGIRDAIQGVYDAREHHGPCALWRLPTRMGVSDAALGGRSTGCPNKGLRATLDGRRAHRSRRR